MRTIKIAEYHNDPITVLVFPDGTEWKVRQPLEADHYRTQEVAREHNRRVNAFAKEITARALAVAEEMEDDKAGREIIDRDADEDAIPLECTVRYLNAAILAVFVEPTQTPETVLEKLGPGIINELHVEIMQVLDGEAAKKKLAGK